MSRDPSLFFNDNAISKRLYSSGENTKSIDGTGINESVNAYAACEIVKYIGKKIGVNLKVLDCGAGKGFLQKALNEHGYDAYSMEGSSSISNHIVCNRDKYAIVDLAKQISDPRLDGVFNLSTSFELIEHIHPEEEDVFWSNLIYMSDYHLCSIHMDGCERLVGGKLLVGPDHDAHVHCNMKPMNMWKDYFSSRNIKYEIIGNWPKKSMSQEEFRREVKLKQWNDWQSCSFWLLDFTEAK